jgi:RecB family exonuclease
LFCGHSVSRRFVIFVNVNPASLKTARRSRFLSRGWVIPSAMEFESVVLADRVMNQLLEVIVVAKVGDPFAAVVVITKLGARRVRLELGRRMALVNVQVLSPKQIAEWIANGPIVGVTVVVLGPIDALASEQLEAIHYVPIAMPEPLGLDRVRIVSCPDAAVECRVAVSALLAARSRATPWSSMAVAVATTSSSPMLTAALSAAGIPFHLSAGRVMTQCVAARFVVGAIESSSSNWNRGAISALWSMVPIVDPATGRLVPVEQWERISRRYGVVDAHDWPLLVERCSRSPFGVVASDVVAAVALAAFVERLVDTIGSASPAELALGLSTFLPDPGSTIGRSVFGVSSSAEGEATDDVRKVLFTIPTRSDSDSGSGSGSGSGELLSSDELVRAFEKALVGRTMMGTGRVGEGVQVGTPEALSFGAFDAVVVVGLSDEGTRRDDDRRVLRSTALATLVNGRAATLTVPRSSARSQRAVAPFPGLLEALTLVHSLPVTADDLHAWPSALEGVEMIPSMTAARVGSSGCPSLDVADQDLVELHDELGHGADLLGDDLVAGVSLGLRRSVTADRARRSDEWSSWDGKLAELSGWSPQDSVWAVTQMESFHQCRLRVFLTGVLGARPLDRPEDGSDPEARSVGTFVHKVMEYLAGDLLQIELSQRPSWNVWVEGLSSDDLRVVIDRAVIDLRAEGKLGRGAWWEAQIRWLEARLRHYLAGEAGAGDGFEPIQVEGGPTRDAPWILSTRVGDIRMQGRADRIEARGETIRVVDFKTGRLTSLQGLGDSADPLDEGRKLQLPVYAAMTANALSVGTDGASGVYVNPLSPHRSKRRVTMDVSSLIEPAKTVLREAFENMNEGMFTYETVAGKGNDKFCLFCDVKACCPVNRIVMGKTKAAAASVGVSASVVTTGASTQEADTLNGSLTQSGASDSEVVV